MKNFLKNRIFSVMQRIFQRQISQHYVSNFQYDKLSAERYDLRLQLNQTESELLKMSSMVDIIRDNVGDYTRYLMWVRSEKTNANRQIKVLIIEDHLEHRAEIKKMIQHYLESSDRSYIIDETDNYHEATLHLISNYYTVIFSDFEVNHGNMQNVLHVFREQITQNVIVISNYPETESIKSKIPYIAYLGKTFSANQLALAFSKTGLF